MPNVCDNRLAISGPVDTVMDLVRSAESQEQAFDFDRLLPMPDDLKGEAGRALGPSGRPCSYEWSQSTWGSVERVGGGPAGIRPNRTCQMPLLDRVRASGGVP